MITFFHFLNCCTGWGYIVAFTKVPKIYQIYHTWIHPLHHSPLSYHPLIPGIVSTGFIFPFTYMWTYYLYCVCLPTPLSPLFLLPLLLMPPDRTCSTFLLSDFIKEKKWHFRLFKITTQWVSLYYSPNWFISFFLLFTLVPFYGSFSRLNNSIFILVQRIHQPYSPN
jgi:hypothetical protein